MMGEFGQAAQRHDPEKRRVEAFWQQSGKARLQAQRFLDEGEEVGALRRQAGGGHFAGEGGEQFGIDESGLVVGEPLGEGAHEGGEAGVVGGFGGAVVGDGNGGDGLAAESPVERAEGGGGGGGVDFQDEGGEG